MWELARWLTVFAAGLAVGIAIELVLIRYSVRWYFRTGFPLGEELVPIRRLPEGSGETSSVSWRVIEKSLVHYWTGPKSVDGILGLHGAVRCISTPREVLLKLRWSPPWTPLVGLAWLFFFAITTDKILTVGPIVLSLVIICFGVYRQAAVRAAAELRWRFVSRSDSDEYS
jgi:hypothetical protein